MTMTAMEEASLNEIINVSWMRARRQIEASEGEKFLEPYQEIALPFFRLGFGCALVLIWEAAQRMGE